MKGKLYIHRMTQINFNKSKIHGASPLQYEFDTLIIQKLKMLLVSKSIWCIHLGRKN